MCISQDKKSNLFPRVFLLLFYFFLSWSQRKIVSDCILTIWKTTFRNKTKPDRFLRLWHHGMLCHHRLNFARHVQWNEWCHTHNWEPFQRYAVKSYCRVQLKWSYIIARGNSHYPCYSHSTVILQQLFKIFDYPQRGDAIMAENQFQGHQEKSKSLNSANRAKGLCKRREEIFFSSSFRFSLC